MLTFFVDEEKYNQLSIFFVNIFIYLILLLTIFCVLFLFNKTFFFNIVDLKFLYFIPILNISVLLVLLSMAGLPPLLGFCAKFLMFIYFFSKEYIFVYIFIVVLNIFYLFFYIQNVRFLIKKSTHLNTTWLYDFKFQEYVLFFLCLLNVLNIFGIFFIDDFLTIITFFTCFIL